MEAEDYFGPPPGKWESFWSGLVLCSLVPILIGACWLIDWINKR